MNFNGGLGMNGTEGACPAKVVFDTNVIIKYVNKKPGFIDLETRFAEDGWYISVITRIELYGFPGISPKERDDITRFLKRVIVIPLSDDVEQRTIEARRQFHLKTPDAIVAATTLELGATLVTGDGPLSKKKIPGLPIIFEPSLSSKTSWRSVFRKNRSLWIALGCLTIITLVFAILFILK
jgi:predicted nucleic acid-binding protein